MAVCVWQGRGGVGGVGKVVSWWLKTIWKEDYSKLRNAFQMSEWIRKWGKNSWIYRKGLKMGSLPCYTVFCGMCGLGFTFRSEAEKSLDSPVFCGTFYTDGNLSHFFLVVVSTTLWQVL